MKLFLNCKKGSHVGVVLSFVIFIAFVFFLFIIVQPNLGFEDRQNSLEQIGNRLKEETSNQLTSASVLVGSPGSNCLELSGFFSTTGMTNRIIVRDDSGNVLSAGVSGQSLQVDRQGNTFFRIYESEEFFQETGSLGSCQTLNQGQYDIGLLRTTNEVFASKVANLTSTYYSNYDILKQDFEISLNEFGFDFVYNDGTTTSADNIGTDTGNIDVYVREIPVQYINNNAAVERGFFRVKTW